MLSTAKKHPASHSKFNHKTVHAPCIALSIVRLVLTFVPLGPVCEFMQISLLLRIHWQSGEEKRFSLFSLQLYKGAYQRQPISRRSNARARIFSTSNQSWTRRPTRRADLLHHPIRSYPIYKLIIRWINEPYNSQLTFRQARPKGSNKISFQIFVDLKFLNRFARNSTSTIIHKIIILMNDRIVRRLVQFYGYFLSSVRCHPHSQKCISKPDLSLNRLD